MTIIACTNIIIVMKISFIVIIYANILCGKQTHNQNNCTQNDCDKIYIYIIRMYMTIYKYIHNICIRLFSPNNSRTAYAPTTAP